MNANDSAIEKKCPECGRVMAYHAPTPNIHAYWRCACGVSAPEPHPEFIYEVSNSARIAFLESLRHDPRQVTPSNREAFTDDDERQKGPI